MAAGAVVEEVAAHLRAMADLPYLGEAVDQRAHALQAAAHALAAGADDELVVATLLHDVGRVTGADDDTHARAGAAWCAPRFGARVAWLVGAHVDAKRYLMSTEAYYRLSRASVESLRLQGGPLTGEELAAFTGHPWVGDAVRLRRWDDAAKSPAARARAGLGPLRGRNRRGAAVTMERRRFLRAGAGAAALAGAGALVRQARCHQRA